MSIELSKAYEAQFGFAEKDEEIYVEGDVKPGEKCLYVTSMDGEGVGLVGTLQEIRDFVGLMARGLDLEIEKEKKNGVPADQGPVVAGEDPDPEVAPEPVEQDVRRCSCGMGDYGTPGHDGGFV